MHPLMSRFMDLSNAVLALEKTENESTLDGEESAWLAAAHDCAHRDLEGEGRKEDRL